MRSAERWLQRFASFEKALRQLEKGLVQPTFTDLEREGLIQRFEYSFELAWKTLQDFLHFQGYDSTNGPKKVIVQAAQDGYIADGHGWLEMLEDFLRTKHTYDEETAELIFTAVRQRYFQLLSNLHDRFVQEKQVLMP